MFVTSGPQFVQLWVSGLVQQASRRNCPLRVSSDNLETFSEPRSTGSQQAAPCQLNTQPKSIFTAPAREYGVAAAADPGQRFSVKIFESGNTLSLDSASVTIPNAARTASDRVDLPMRAFAGGFYSNLKSMYDYLGVQYQSQPFVFEFAQSHTPYFTHASNLHQLPARSKGVGLITFLLEIAYLAVCYIHFSLCCFFIAPQRGETLQAYVERTWTPKGFVTYYILPLISSVTTCPHESLLEFPASDLTEYKRRTHRAPHYTVSEGVRAAQDRLAKGIHYELNAGVTAVEPHEKGVRLSWKRCDGHKQVEMFDKVVLAVAPDVVGQVFEPLRPYTSRIPTTLVESVVHTDESVLNLGERTATSPKGAAQLIHLNTSTQGEHKTESHHVQPCGAIVTTCPHSALEKSQIAHSAKFTRVLRSPQSQRIVNAIFGLGQDYSVDEKSTPRWKNGDDNVYLVGGWCWDVMISRALKLAATAAVIWLALPLFISGTHRSQPVNLQNDLKSWAVPSYLRTLLAALLLTRIWTAGSRQTNDNRVHGIQRTCKGLLVYTGLPILILLWASSSDFKWSDCNQETKIQCAVGAILCFGATPNKKSVYGLQHARLHLDTQVPMWMNMGYWKKNPEHTSRSKSLAEACRDLLNLVLAEAELSSDVQSHRSRSLIDVGFGCGEQTIHLMSEQPVRPSDKLWWDDQHHKVHFDQYVGVTQDESQCQYAQKRVDELEKANIRLFCADASKPASWNEELLKAVQTASSKSQETWLLALDTAYHFSPSRWVLIECMFERFEASYMAFDLCISPQATTLQKLCLRALTTLMGAPWTNFVTPAAYRQKLVEIGYANDDIKITDISEHVFAPLAKYMDDQDRTLKTIGLGLGSFRAAKQLFGWWGRTGIIRGVVVVARRGDSSMESAP
ncbi:hypothetical protein OPT61_g4390 [Boeremia exigua]|uniref:Uncharacterized protein n=1 Tax=Boeremia exigua TaxID=749465 RepID=A0ACC2IE67_9PLEO|nr:hypothetical protein OPT61_g4390 [Boeremia exigua]